MPTLKELGLRLVGSAKSEQGQLTLDGMIVPMATRLTPEENEALSRGESVDFANRTEAAQAMLEGEVPAYELAKSLGDFFEPFVGKHVVIMIGEVETTRPRLRSV